MKPLVKTYPLTESQLGIFLTWISNPSSTQSNMPILGKIDKDISTEKVAQVYMQLAECYPTIKTRFVLEDGIPRQ